MENIYVTTATYETFKLSDGRSFIDFSGGFGYQIPEIISAVDAQINKIGLSSRVLMSTPLLSLCAALAELLGPDLNNSYVCNSGDEAFEGAIKLARTIHPNRKTIIAVEGNDYGEMSYGAMVSQFDSSSSLASYLGVKVVWVNANIDLKTLDCWDDCLAFCYGPFIRAKDGTRHTLDPKWLASAEDLAHRNRCLTIWTDIDTCLGSLGSLFSHKLLQANPNVVILGNSLGGGCIPIGTYSCSHSIAHAAYGRHSPAKHGSTTAGNPPSCVAALEAFRISSEKLYWQSSIANGNLLAAELHEYSIRQYGGWVFLNLTSAQQADVVRRALYAEGIFVRRENHAEIVFRCPLSAREPIIKSAAETIKRTLSYAIQ